MNYSVLQITFLFLVLSFVKYNNTAYTLQECPKVAGDSNSDKQECIDLINQINEQIKEGFHF